MVAGFRASEQPRHLADLTPASAPSSSMPHEPSSLLPSPTAAEALPPALPLKQHASAVLAAAGVDMRSQGGATAPAAEPQDGEAGSGGGGAGRPAPALAAGAGLGPVHHGNGAGQPPQQQPVSAAAAAPKPGVALPAAGPPPSPGAAAAAELEAILGRLMQIDKEGWFRHPVSELVAPKYYKIIKQPMCFEVMRSKIHGRQYLTWQELARDFDLICSNALKYNQKRSHVYKQALTLSRVGKKVLAEVEQQGRRAMAALLAAGAAEAAPVSLQLTPADSQAVPSSLFRAGGVPASAALLRSQSTADTATTEGADSEPMALEGAPWTAEDEADPAGYSSYEATDMEEDEAEGAAARQQAAALLDAAARDAVLAQPWAWLAGDSAAALDAAQQQQQQACQQQQEARPQQGAQQPATAPAVATTTGHSREWKAARRGVEWRVRWLEHRLAELHHQRLRYEQQLEAEAEQEAARQQAVQRPAGATQQQQVQGAAAEAAKKAAVQPAAATAGAEQPAAQQELQVKVEDGAQVPAAAEPLAAAQAPAVAGQPLPPRLWQHRPHRELAECQLPGLLQHPFIAAHSVLGTRQQAAASGASAASGGGQLPAAMDSDDFPAEVHAALELLDQKLSSLRRQLVAMQRPTTQAALQCVQAVRVPGYRGGGGGGARRSGGWTPRSGGATPRGTPRSGSLYRDSSLGKRRRVPEYDVGEVVTPLGAPKFVERAQVKTIDTPRVRPLPNTEVKKRQAALEAYASQRKEGKEESKALAAIDLLCPGESSSEEDTSDEAYLRRHHRMEVEERARYEAVLGVAVKKNKQQPKMSKERGKQFASARHVSRTLSAPAMVGNGGTPAAAAAAGAPGASPASSMLPGAASAPAGSLAAATAPASGSTAPSPAKQVAAGTAAAPSAPPAPPASSANAAASKQPAGAPGAAAPAAAPQQPEQQEAQQQQAQPGSQPSASGAPGAAASSDAAVAAVTAAPPASLPSLAAPNGLPMGLMLPPLNPAQMTAQSMAAQMAQAHMAAMAAVVGPPGGKQGGSSGGSAGGAGASGLLGPPFGLTPAMAAAMAAAMPPLGGLPPGLQGILPNGGASAPANGGGGRGSGRRGRPPGRGRPRR